MQDYSSRSRSDRRDDARRAPATAHTPYRPRTQRKGFTQRTEREEAEAAFTQRFDKNNRSERPHRGAPQEGRYRPRTTKPFSRPSFREEYTREEAFEAQDGTQDSVQNRKQARPQRHNRDERGRGNQRGRDERAPRFGREYREESGERRQDWREDRREDRFAPNAPLHSHKSAASRNSPVRREDRRPDWRPDRREDRFAPTSSAPRTSPVQREEHENRHFEERQRRRDQKEDRLAGKNGRRPDRREDRFAPNSSASRNSPVRCEDRENQRKDRFAPNSSTPRTSPVRREDRGDRRNRDAWGGENRYFDGLNEILGTPQNEKRAGKSGNKRREDQRKDRFAPNSYASRNSPVQREDRNTDRLRNESPWARDARREAEAMRPPIDLSQPMRLNRYIAHCGECSRRDADEMITNGEISINGVVCTTLGEKIIPQQDVVTRNGETLKLEQKVYILLNKPKDYICTVEDPHAEHTVLELVKDACSERIYPVGRLDRNTTGLLLLTNDGELTDRLTHPSYAKQKIYEVTLDRKVNASDMEQLLAGVTLDDGEVARVDEIAYVRPNDSATVGVTIHTGQNRVVRRMFDSLGFRVERLDRVYYAGMTKRNLPRGTWRYLTAEEVRMLKNDSYK